MIAAHRGRYADDNTMRARRHRPSFVPTPSKGFSHKNVIPRHACVQYSSIQGGPVNFDGVYISIQTSSKLLNNTVLYSDEYQGR